MSGSGGAKRRPWWEAPPKEAAPDVAARARAKQPERTAPRRGGTKRGTGRSTRLELLHADDALVVVAKPAGLPSVPSEGDRGKTCLSELRASHPGALAVHRLDRDVSGALLFALDEATRAALEEQFRARSVGKTYLAAVNGTPRPAQGTIRRPIVDLGKRAEIRVKGQPATTHYRVVRPIERSGRASLVEIELETGRYNQIRLHFAALGHPLLGERKYARGRDSALRFHRPALHAWKLAFDHPRTGRRLEIEAPLPEDFARLVAP